MRILLLGVTGQVGWELARTLSGLGELLTTARDRSADLQLETGDLNQLRATLDATAPDVVVNATAYTAVDRAEEEVEQATLLNRGVPALIGGWAAQHGALVIHYSTDYVVRDHVACRRLQAPFDCLAVIRGAARAGRYFRKESTFVTPEGKLSGVPKLELGNKLNTSTGRLRSSATE